MTNISTPSAEYDAAAQYWRDCRDIIAGARVVKAAGERYLPRLGGMDETQYNAFKTRAMFLSATSRTVSGLVGMVFRRDAVIQIPPALTQLMTTLTPDGESLQDVLERVVTEVVSVNYFGLLVDHPEFNPDIITAAQASRTGVRPYISLYAAETILGVEHAIANGVRAVSRVRLQESQDLIRELTLQAGFYQVIMHTRVGTEWIAQAPYTPLMQGKPLGFIPFQITSDEPRPTTKPPIPLLYDLVDTNISHYQTSADYDHGVHWTALPTPWVTGFGDGDLPQLTLGASSVWVFSNPDTKVGMLEYAGTGLSNFKDRLAEKEASMVVLGARILAPDKTGHVESTQTHTLKRIGENSVLASMARTVSRQISQALVWLAQWAGIDGTIDIHLNTDYVPGELTSQMFEALFKALQSGAISQETFFEKLQSSEFIKPSLTFEDEQERRERTASDLPQGEI